MILADQPLGGCYTSGDAAEALRYLATLRGHVSSEDVALILGVVTEAGPPVAPLFAPPRPPRPRTRSDVLEERAAEARVLAERPEGTTIPEVVVVQGCTRAAARRRLVLAGCVEVAGRWPRVWRAAVAEGEV